MTGPLRVAPEADFYERRAIDTTTDENVIEAAKNTLRSRFSVAWLTTVHMAADASFDDLDPLDVSELEPEDKQPAADLRAETLRALLIVHMVDVGGALVDGSHKAADDSTTLAAIPAAEDLATCIDLVVGLAAATADHGDASGVHFNNDATLAAVAITPDPPTTLAHCVTAMNLLLAALKVHGALHSA